MSKHSTPFYIKAGSFVVLCSILLCAAVFICVKQTDKTEETDITLKNIMTRNQIYLICQPRTKDERYDNAIKYWQEMNYIEAYQVFIDIKEGYPREDSSEAATVNHALGCLCLDTGDYEQSYEFLNSAYVTMTDLYGESSNAALAVLSSIVYYDYVTGKLEQCLKDARIICDATPPLAIWAITNRVQMLVNYDCGEASMAVRGTYFLIDEYMKKQDETFTWDNMLSLQDYLTHQEKGFLDLFGYRLLALLSWDIGNAYASLASGENERAKAEKWYMASLYICQNLLDEEVPGLSAQVNADYAYFLGKYGETKAAFSLIEQVIETQESFGGNDNTCPDLVKTYSTYGEMLLFLSGDSVNALAYYEKAREFSESIYGLNSKKSAQTYYLLGKYYAMLNEYEVSLNYLKQCEEIKKNTLLLKDMDTINLYLYLAGVYKTQGELELAEEYKQRAVEVSDYLMVHILNTNDTDSSTNNELSDGNFDLSQYKDGEKWQLAIDAYINALQTGDVNVLIDALQMEFVELIPVMAENRLGVQVDTDEILALYTNLYQKELLLQKDELINRFGDEYHIRFEPYAVEYTADHDINLTNDYFFRYFNSEIVLTDMVVITGQFFVSGSANAEEQEVTDHLLCKALPIVNVNGNWKLGIPDDFPQLTQETLADALGISSP